MSGAAGKIPTRRRHPVETEADDLTVTTDQQLRGPVARRRWILAGTVAGALAVGGLGFVSHLWVKSPQQHAAEAGPPAATVLTAPVERRIVSQTLVLRGEISPERVFEVTPTPATGTVAPVVTGLRVGLGDEVRPGDVLLEVSGRPLVALPGDVPVYRDMRPGAEGEDIAQLQRALRELGYAATEPDGVFGPATKQAVETYYEALGYPAPTTSEGDADTVSAASAEVKQLERQVEDARVALSDAVDADERAARRRDLDRAQEDLNAAAERLAQLTRRTGPMVPASEVVFLPTFPAAVDSLTAQVGMPVEAPLIGLASGRIVVTAEVGPAQRELLRVGQAVEIHPESIDDQVRGTVASIEEPRPGSGADPTAPPVHAMLVTPETPLAKGLAGRPARLVLTVSSSEQEVLAVPVSAVYAAHDGTAYVLVSTATGQERQVSVALATSGDGYVAVTPLAGSLSPDDQVVIGSALPPGDEAAP